MRPINLPIYGLLASLLVLTLAGCQQEDQLLPSIIPEQTFTISGTVYAHGHGASGATVSNGKNVVTTNSEGEYVFTDVARGAYMLCSHAH